MTVTVPSSLQNLDPGVRLGDVGSIVNMIQRGLGVNTYDALVASTTQTQLGGTKLRHGLNIVATANGSDAVTLPTAIPGNSILILVNHTSQTIQLFPPVGGTINAASPNAAVTVANATTSVYVCGAANQYWGGAITNEA